jgi:hypothetical protein
MDNKDSAVHTKLTNISSNGIKFVLERSSLSLLGLNGGKDLILASIISDNGTEEPSLSSLDLGSRKENWGRNIVRGLGEFSISLMLVLSEEALLKGLLLKMIRLTSHGRLIGHNSRSLNADSINWDVDSILDHDNVTDHKVVSVSWNFN